MHVINARFILLHCVAVIGLCGIDVWGGEEIVFAELDGVQLVSQPQSVRIPWSGPPSMAPESAFVRATVIEIRTGWENTIESFTNVRVDGDVHQAWYCCGLQIPDQSAKAPPDLSTIYCDCRYLDYDSHLLISNRMVLTETGGGYTAITETNDRSTAASAELPPTVGGFTIDTGLGPIFMSDSTDSFTLQPEFRTNSVDFAYLVTPIDGEVTLTLGVTVTEYDSGESWQANFGFDGNEVVVPFIVPEPCLGKIFAIGLVAVVVSVRRRQFVTIGGHRHFDVSSNV